MSKTKPKPTVEEELQHLRRIKNSACSLFIPETGSVIQIRNSDFVFLMGRAKESIKKDLKISELYDELESAHIHFFGSNL